MTLGCGSVPETDEGQTYGAMLREKGVGLGAGTTPTRRRRVAKDKPHYNAWERGIARDDRGMPYLDEQLNPLGVKRFAEDYRHKFAERDARIADERLTGPHDTSKG